MSSSYILPTAAAALALGPVTAVEFRLGSGVGYIPSSTLSSLQGNVVLTGVPSAPVADTPNVYRYRIQLSSTQVLSFGEIGLYMAGGELLSLTAYSSLQVKTGDPSDTDGVGGHIDVFVQTTGEVAVSLQGAKLAPELNSLSDLPSTFASDINLAVIPDPSNPGASSVLAYRRGAIWNFDKYDQVGASVPVVAGTFNQFTVNGAIEADSDTLVQFFTGKLIGVTRRVFNTYQGGGQTSIDLDSPLTEAVTPGTRVAFFSRRTSGGGTGGSGGNINVGDLTAAMQAALGARAPTVSADSVAGRIDNRVDIELARVEYNAISTGTGYVNGDTLIRSNWQTASGAQLSFWFNATQGQRLTSAPAGAHVTPKTNDAGTVEVDIDTPLIAVTYIATAAGAGYSVNDVIGLSRRVSQLGLATDYWVNLTSTQPLASPPVPSNLRPTSGLKPIRSTRTKTPIVVNAGQSTQVVAPSTSRNRHVSIKIPTTATGSTYLKYGTGASDSIDHHDVGPMFAGDQYDFDEDEWNGLVEAFNTAGVTLYVTTIQ